MVASYVFNSFGDVIVECVDGRVDGGARDFEDTCDDACTEDDGVLDRLGVLVLGDGLITVVIFLGNECYGDRVGGVEEGCVFEEAVAFAEADVADGDGFGLASTGYFRVLAGATGEEKCAVDELGYI